MNYKIKKKIYKKNITKINYKPYMQSKDRKKFQTAFLN